MKKVMVLTKEHPIALLAEALTAAAKDALPAYASRGEPITEIRIGKTTVYSTEKKPTKGMKIFTRSYDPFRMAGGPDGFISCVIDRNHALGPYATGKGFLGYLIEAPDGTTVVAEATTGALVGPTLAEVRKDIARGDLKVMRRQVRDAREQSKQARSVSEEEFWKRMEKGGKT